MAQPPVTRLLDLAARGVFEPRQTARIVIDARPSGVERLMMVLLAAVAQSAVWVAVLLIAPGLLPEGARFGFAGHGMLAALALANYIIVTGVATALGRALGGKGDRDAVASAVAWQMLVTVALAPLQALAMSGGALAGLGAIVYLAGSVWILASCIAEAHRFARTGPVAMTVIGAMMALGLIGALLMQGAGFS